MYNNNLSFQKRGWNQDQYQPRNNNRYSQNQGRTRSVNFQKSTAKKSGCKVVKDHVAKSGAKHALFISGWKVTRRHGFQSFLAVEASAKYQNGAKKEQYITMVCTWKSQTGVSTLWAHWNRSTQTLWIPDLNICASGNRDFVSYITPKSAKNRR